VAYQETRIERALRLAAESAERVGAFPVKREPPVPDVEAIVAGHWARLPRERRIDILWAFALLGIPLQDGLSL